MNLEYFIYLCFINKEEYISNRKYCNLKYKDLMESNKSNMKTIDFRTDFLDLGFEIRTLEDFYSALAHKITNNRHIINFYVMMFITDGNGVHEIDFKKYEYKANNIIFIRRGQEHSWLEFIKTKGYIILFTKEFLNENQIKFKDIVYSFPYNSYIYKPILKILNSNYINSYKTLISYLYEEYMMSENPQKGEILQCLLRTLLLKINIHKPMSNNLGNDEQKTLFINLQKLLDSEIIISRNAKDYSHKLGVSFKKLNTICNLFTNKSAKEFIDEVLILKAKQMLINNHCAVNQVAYSLGFDEPTNFTKFFKKHTSLSPKEFQQSN